MHVTWQPKSVDWNVHGWTMMMACTVACSYCLHCISQWRRYMPLTEHVYCMAIAFKMTEALVQILHYAWTFLCKNYLDDSEGWSYGQLVIGSFITTTCPFTHHVLCRVFWWNIHHPGDSAPVEPKFGTCDFWLFPKLKSPLISFEREEISDHRWDSGKYDAVADGYWENCVRSQGAYFEVDWRITPCSVSCILNKCHYFILHGWIHSGQTSYRFLMGGRVLFI